MPLYVQEAFVNATEGYMFGESDTYEIGETEIGRLFRGMQREYGRCTGKVYVDQPDGEPMPVGWCFVKEMQYEDTKATYIRETWITVHEAPDTVTRKVNYHDLRQPVAQS